MQEPAKEIQKVHFFPKGEKGECCYGLFDRHGGVSASPYDTLNVGFSLSDDDKVVMANRERVKGRMSVDVLLSAKQVHGDAIYVLKESLAADMQVEDYDALVTNKVGVGLMIQHADCQAILLYDPVQGAVGAVHSGWRSSVLNLAGKTVQVMTEQFGCDPDRMQAVISPSLGPCCAEFVNYKKELPASFQQYMDERCHFDFWQISRMQLQESGLRKEAITLPRVCTCCSDDYFSYRRACRTGDGKTGRNCSVIALVPE